MYELDSIIGGHPLDLSILLSGGKENNCDSVSTGEGKRNKPVLKLGRVLLPSNVGLVV